MSENETAEDGTYRKEFCDFCSRNRPERDLQTVFTIRNGIQQREHACSDCKEEARSMEAPPVRTDGGGVSRTECKAPDCTDDAHRYLARYCSGVCRNVAIKTAAKAVAESTPGDLLGPSDLPDEAVAEIRERTEKAHTQIQEKLEQNLQERDTEPGADR